MLRLEVVLPIGYIEAAPLPLVGLALPVLLSRVDEGLHPVRVGRVILLEIHNVKLICEALLDVPHREVIPLRVVERVKVEIQEQIVLVLIHFFDLAKVA